MTGLFDATLWMDAEAVLDLTAAMHRRSYAAGQCVYAQEAAGDEMYRLVRGHVRLSVGDAEGREAVFLHFGPGDFFGASSLVDDENRPHTAEAVTAIEIDALGRAAFDRLRAIHPSFNDALMRLFARQMRVASEQLVAFHLCSLHERVIQRLLELSTRQARRDAATGAIVLAVSQSELAGLAGASRQRVNKVLGQLQAEAVLSLRKGAILLHDVGALKAAIRVAKVTDPDLAAGYRPPAGRSPMSHGFTGDRSLDPDGRRQ